VKPGFDSLDLVDGVCVFVDDDPPDPAKWLTAWVERLAAGAAKRVQTITWRSDPAGRLSNDGRNLALARQRIILSCAEAERQPELSYDYLSWLDGDRRLVTITTTGASGLSDDLERLIPIASPWPARRSPTDRIDPVVCVMDAAHPGDDLAAALATFDAAAAAVHASDPVLVVAIVGGEPAARRALAIAASGQHRVEAVTTDVEGAVALVTSAVAVIDVRIDERPGWLGDWAIGAGVPSIAAVSEPDDPGFDPAVAAAGLAAVIDDPIGERRVRQPAWQEARRTRSPEACAAALSAAFDRLLATRQR
jgi:hypothetical protein